MLRSILSSYNKRTICVLFCQKHTFLTNSYSCSDAWNSRFSSTILNKVNLSDFYNILDQTYVGKGVISAVDVDIYANSLRDGSYLDELRDLLHKLRLSADTGNTLESTHHATVRNYLDYGDVQDLVEILKDPLNYGIFLDDFSANILLDKLINSQDYEKAATVATQIMLQEDYSNEITCSLCQYAAYKYISRYTPPPPEPEPDTKNIEEVKIRIKFLRNPYFDDHFDITNTYLSSGKTLTWMSASKTDNLNVNLEVLGWLVYQKYEKLLKCCEQATKLPNIKIYKETLDLLQRESDKENVEKEIVQKCISILNGLTITDKDLENALKINVENAINKRQTQDITAQQEAFNLWIKVREDKLLEQTKRLDRAKRIQQIEEKQKELESEEQKLWFFDNEEKIDLEIENKEVHHKEHYEKKKETSKKDDEDYIPPEIIPKRR